MIEDNKPSQLKGLHGFLHINRIHVQAPYFAGYYFTFKQTLAQYGCMLYLATAKILTANGPGPSLCLLSI